MKTARQRILEYIQTHRAVTTAELCAALNSTEANMRHHLAILQQQGLVKVIESAGGSAGGNAIRGARRGRPARVFGPVDPAPTENLIELAAALLEETLPGLPANELDQFLERVAARLAARLSKLHTAQSPGAPNRRARPRFDNLTARLFATVEHLNHAHYQARWEARPDAPRLTLGHCPYGNLPLRSPEICMLDARLLEILLGAPVEQLKRLEKDARGLPYCLFRLI